MEPFKFIDNDNPQAVKSGATLPGELDLNDLILVPEVNQNIQEPEKFPTGLAPIAYLPLQSNSSPKKEEQKERKVTVGQFIQSGEFSRFGDPEERANLVVKTAEKLGGELHHECSPIRLFGQNLCAHPNGRTLHPG